PRIQQSLACCRGESLEIGELLCYIVQLVSLAAVEEQQYIEGAIGAIQIDTISEIRQWTTEIGTVIYGEYFVSVCIGIFHTAHPCTWLVACSYFSLVL